MSTITTDKKSWTIHNAKELYSTQRWGAGHFDISDSGEVIVKPNGINDENGINLMQVVSGLQERGVDMPVLLRFGDILRTQIQRMHNDFTAAINDAGYKGGYRGVYPIKVNQQQQVIQEISRYGKAHQYGLEAGSKPELIAALTYLHDNDGLLICNGYKDAEFIDLALYARKIGIHCIIVIESLRELRLIIERSSALGVLPSIGIRVKLTSKAGGHWQESAGDQSVFGLNSAQIIESINELRDADMLDCLELLHYHLGSQLPNIRSIRSSLIEACRVYEGLIKEGAKMGMLDIGGGLAVDYDGSHTDFSSSRNYTTSEYCASVVSTIAQIMDDTGLDHPTIVTEAGRATVAHHSVLLFNILDVNQNKGGPKLPLPDDAHEHVNNMHNLANEEVTLKNCQQFYHDALYYREEARQLFKHGGINLRERAYVEQHFWEVMHSVADKLKEMKYVPDDFDKLEQALADIYYGNFSLFQSLPDSWAIDQLFPIMPIHRLNEPPTQQAVISDITCDCDGRIDQFIDLQDVKKTIPLHKLRDNEEYYLGVFLVGAYQETLGDLHNLFGDTHVVDIRATESGELEFETEIEGDSVADVLSYVEYDPKDMIALFKKKAEQAVRKNLISGQERKEIVAAYQEGLSGYTYLER